MTHYRLHNPVSAAHIENLLDRLSGCPTVTSGHSQGGSGNGALVRGLVEVVRAMDRGALSVEAAQSAFASQRLSGFSFSQWLEEMVEEGVYLEMQLDRAA